MYAGKESVLSINKAHTEVKHGGLLVSSEHQLDYPWSCVFALPATQVVSVGGVKNTQDSWSVPKQSRSPHSEARGGSEPCLSFSLQQNAAREHPSLHGVHDKGQPGDCDPVV